MQGGSTAQKAQTTKHSHTCKGGGTAQKAQTTKHSHTCKLGGVQRKKHKLYKTPSHMQGGSTAQKAQTTKCLVRERVTLCTRQYSLYLRSILFLSDVQWIDHHQHPTEGTIDSHESNK